ncbi:HAD-superfamily hydrolase subfamily IA, variant 3 [Nostoc sp. HK-01]|uniref:HAD-superfamily hydrolase n=1 Tax=Nostoc cycadae WK-1 TaxID=1861711 RepID=A0A2H6LIW1_9NOSO|nr:HAD family phosphatase [Nostoc cycadae]BBD58002.1 HAD-superfamily hydrolase subfamily IA, variant 3 [Nostoc sp. HK-01]GBE93158.1 HAD-superfamily hydrolase [Nostoc cycadae WK-1]
MSLKAILFDFNGVIINDEHIHLQLIDEILIQENLQPQKLQERQTCLGRSDRACFQELLANRGRVLTEESLNQLLSRKAEAYLLELEKLEKLPIYPGVEDLIYQVRSQNINLGLVSGALSKEIEFVLHRTKLTEYFKVIVAGDDITTSKPNPEGYLLAVERFNQKYPELNLQPQECLAIEDTFAGIQAAKQSQMKVIGVANTYPFHMLQRCCNWTVDYLTDLELERVQNVFSGKEPQPSVSEC